MSQGIFVDLLEKTGAWIIGHAVGAAIDPERERVVVLHGTLG
jgi:hypothetical protein